MNRNEQSIKMGKRLKELREETLINGKKMSHVELKKELKELYGIEISRDSLMNYEVSEVNHSKFGTNLKMNAEYLSCFSKFYGVSTDFLLGLTDIKTPNVEIQDICKKTGLSENAVKILAQIHHSSNGNDYLSEICTYLSFLIEHNSEYLVSPVINVLEYAEATVKIKHYKNTVLPTLKFSSEYKVSGWSVSNEDAETLLNRQKVFDEIRRLQDVCEVKRYNCEKSAASAFSSFIDYTEQQHENNLNQMQK